MSCRRPIQFLLQLLLLVPSLADADTTRQRPVLTVLNWSWYVEVDESVDESERMAVRSPVLREFEEEFGCEVQYVELEDEIAMRDLLIASPDEVDLVNLSSSLCVHLYELGLVRAIDLERVPHTRDLRDALAGSLEPTAPVAYVPYFAGHTGLLVNRAVTVEPLTRWDQFWDPRAPFAIGLLGGPEVVLGAALLEAGHSVSSNDPAELRTAAALLLENIRAGRVAYVGENVEAVGALVLEGKIGAATLYSSDALSFVDEENIDFVLPEEGAELFVDCWAITSRSRRSELAHAFVDFMLRPEIQVRQSLALHAQVVTNAARDILLVQHADHPHLEYLVGIEGRAAFIQDTILRKDPSAIERLWDRILSSPSP